MAEKTEKATPKKLKDARKKGQVAKAQDFPTAATYIIAVSLTLYLGNFFFRQLGGYMIRLLKAAPFTNLALSAEFYVEDMLKLILIASLPVVGMVAMLGSLISFLLVGPTFAPEVFKPNFKKFNPVENLKQKFKMKTVVELIKSVLKIIGAAVIIFYAVKNEIGDLIHAVAIPVSASAVVFQKIMMKVILWTGIYFILIAVGDLIYQRFTFAKEMRMEKFELKQEYKDTDGNPEIKNKRRQLAQEIAYDEGTGQIRRAKAIVTNPKDIAVAIGYEPEKYAAPWIIAMGTENRAVAIITMGERWNIPIMRNVPLAHQLLDEGKINQFIPESTYDAVGEVLLYIEALKLKEL